MARMMKARVAQEVHAGEAYLLINIDDVVDFDKQLTEQEIPAAVDGEPTRRVPVILGDVVNPAYFEPVSAKPAADAKPTAPAAPAAAKTAAPIKPAADAKQ